MGKIQSLPLIDSSCLHAYENSAYSDSNKYAQNFFDEHGLVSFTHSLISGRKGIDSSSQSDVEEYLRKKRIQLLLGGAKKDCNKQQFVEDKLIDQLGVSTSFFKHGVIGALMSQTEKTQRYNPSKQTQNAWRQTSWSKEEIALVTNIMSRNHSMSKIDSFLEMAVSEFSNDNSQQNKELAGRILEKCTAQSIQDQKNDIFTSSQVSHLVNLKEKDDFVQTYTKIDLTSATRKVYKMKMEQRQQVMNTQIRRRRIIKFDDEPSGSYNLWRNEQLDLKNSRPLVLGKRSQSIVDITYKKQTLQNLEEFRRLIRTLLASFNNNFQSVFGVGTQKISPAINEQRCLETMEKQLLRSQVSLSESQKQIAKALKQLRKIREDQAQNLSVLNDHLQQISSIDVSRWNYQMIGPCVNYTPSQASYAGCAWTSWTPMTSPKKMSLSPKNDLRRLDVTQARMSYKWQEWENTCQRFSTTNNVVVEVSEGQYIPIVEQAFQVGSLEVQSLKIKFQAMQLTNQKQRGFILLRVWRSQRSKQYKDIVLANQIPLGNKANYNFEIANLSEILDVGGSLQIVAFSKSVDSLKIQVSNIEMEVQFGRRKYAKTITMDPLAPKYLSQQKIFFKPDRDVQKHDSTDDLIPLFQEIIPIAGIRIKEVRVNFKAKDQGWGNIKGTVAMCVWGKDKSSQKIYNLSNGNVQHHEIHFRQILKDIQGQSIQFMCTVGGGGGHQIQVSEFEAEIILSPPQISTSDCDEIYQNKLIFLKQSSQKLILSPPVTISKQDVNKILVCFDAITTGSGRSQISLHIIGKKEERILKIACIQQSSSDWRHYAFKSSHPDDIGCFQVGDIVRVEGTVTEDTHLRIKNIRISVKYDAQTTTLMFQQKQLKPQEKPELREIFPGLDLDCGLNQVANIVINFRVQGGEHKLEYWKILVGVIHEKKIIKTIDLTSSEFTKVKEGQFIYQCSTIGTQITPNSVLKFFVEEKSQKAQIVNLSYFEAKVIHRNHPRPETLCSESRLVCVSKIKQAIIKGKSRFTSPQPIKLAIYKPNGTLRGRLVIQSPNSPNTFALPIASHILEEGIAIGDTISFDQETNSYQDLRLTVQFRQLRMPEHEITTLSVSDMVWSTEQNSVSVARDSVMRPGEEFCFDGGLFGVVVSCLWKGEVGRSIKLLLVHKSSKGVIKRQYDIFGSADSQFTKVITMFGSDSELVEKFEPGDTLHLERAIESGGKLTVKQLQLVLIHGPRNSKHIKEDKE